MSYRATQIVFQYGLHTEIKVLNWYCTVLVGFLFLIRKISLKYFLVDTCPLRVQGYALDFWPPVIQKIILQTANIKGTKSH